MKKLGILMIPAVILLLGSCANEEMNQLKERTVELETELFEREVAVADLVMGLEGIQADMRNITQREDLLSGLTVNDVELSKSPQLRIMEDIALVDDLIRRNQVKVQELELKVKASDGRLYEFERVVANLKLDLLDKESEMNQFKASLMELEEDYAGLLDAYSEQLLIGTIQDKALHKGYFAFGSKEELTEMEVVEKEGGILGVGASWKLKDDFNRDYFTEVDIREISRIPLESTVVDIVSHHPADTYELVMEDKLVKEIIITDPDRFWESSKYLAVLVQ